MDDSRINEYLLKKKKKKSGCYYFCGVVRLWDATLTIKATLGENMLDTGGVKEEEKKTKQNGAKTEGARF